jgi:hypothetical protein
MYSKWFPMFICGVAWAAFIFLCLGGVTHAEDGLPRYISSASESFITKGGTKFSRVYWCGQSRNPHFDHNVTRWFVMPDGSVILLSYGRCHQS